jgi:hypothetical protein
MNKAETGTVKLPSPLYYFVVRLDGAVFTVPPLWTVDLNSGFLKVEPGGKLVYGALSGTTNIGATDSPGSITDRGGVITQVSGYGTITN